ESNVRVDTVTNDRPGIILKKQDWDGNPLAGAVFTFAEEGSDTLIGTFTSDSDGYITTAFLSENKNYTLTETAAPHAYHGLETAMTIKVTGSQSGQGTGVNGSTVTVSGPDSEYYSLSQASGTTPATLIIKNRPYVLRAVKQDGDTQLLLAGVHFELHKQVTVDGVTVFDNAVMTGYEDLVTDRDGVIPLIDNTLPAGTYQLREKTAPSGYQTLPGYIEFTVSRTGAVSLLPSMSSAQWVSLTETTDPRIPAELVYTMTIRNYINASVTIRKVDDKGNNLLGAKFRLYKYGTSWETVDGYSEIDLTSVNQITLNKLSVGRYSLEEIHAPDGYVILTKHIYFNIAQDGKASLTDESGTGGNSNAYASISAAGNTITVKNITGAALPSTGGTGTGMLYLLGITLIGLAGVGLVMKRRRRYISA
ncbi:MAG: LPXTG cell wall anchor domain-containing protein, partial [Lachnospiraceae bacterium]|nr:LPXTG cell wall anchor domain-containing protein [Lachnospiraceae bacterium]